MSEKRKCTAEEIEAKRLAAIERRKSRQCEDIMNEIQMQQKLPAHPVLVGIELKTHDTFQVKVKEYSSKLFAVFRTYKSYKYDDAAETHTFSIKDYVALYCKLYEMKSEVNIYKKVPQFVINLLQTDIADENPFWLNAIEPSLINSLNHSQREAVLFGLARKGRVLLSDEMGLGKTRQALAIADFYRDNFPLLIVTNKSTRQFWANEIEKLLPQLADDTHLIKNNRDMIDEAKIVIANYPLNEKLSDKLIKRSFGVIIFDESHNLKNPKSDTAQLATKIAEKAVRIILISGTPALSRPCELFQQLYLLDRKNLGYFDYTKRYSNGHSTEYGWNDKGKSNLHELTILLNRRFMIRRTKDEVAANFLPVRHLHKVNLTLDSKILETNEKSVRHFQTSYEESFGRDRENVLIQFYSISAKLKKNVVCQYLENFLKNPNKILVFAHHTVMMDAICDFYLSNNIDFIRIDGSTKANLRQDYIDRFQNDAECRVAVLSIRACNAGITLNAASLVIFAELYWNPSTMEQAMCRAHRIGQAQEVNVYYLITYETADVLIWNILQDKEQTLKEIGFTKKENATIPSKMTKVPELCGLIHAADECLKDMDHATTSSCFKVSNAGILTKDQTKN